jgi:hypothetical protein
MAERCKIDADQSFSDRHMCSKSVGRSRGGMK